MARRVYAAHEAEAIQWLHRQARGCSAARAIAWLVALVAMAGSIAPGRSAAADTVPRATTRVSVDTTGGDPNRDSDHPAISGNGRYVAFDSDASDLVHGDGNSEPDVFVRDVVAGTTARVSVDTAGGDANNASYNPAISADGRYIAFASDAWDLVAGDVNQMTDVFVRDLVTGVTTRVSVDTGDGNANGSSGQPSISGSGRHVAFHSLASDVVHGDANGFLDVFVRDLVAGTNTRVSVDTSGSDANRNSYSPAISADGRFVSFLSDASDLVVGDTNGFRDVFVRGPT